MSTALPPPPTPGDCVGPYTLGELLGVGGMATVYRAKDDTGGDFAVKILHPGKAETDELRRFRREFLALRDLRHPNVVQVFEAGAQTQYRISPLPLHVIQAFPPAAQSSSARCARKLDDGPLQLRNAH